MSTRTDVDALAELPADEFDERRRAAVERVELRTNRALAEQRDLSDRERGLMADDRDELAALQQAEAIREHRARQVAIVDAAVLETRSGGRFSPFVASDETVRKLEEARRRLENISVLETRAAVATTDMGTARTYAPNALKGPRSLWQAAGIPTTDPDGYAGVVPKFTLPAAVTLVSEGTAHAEFDSVDPDAVTIARAGSWTTLTGEALLSSSVAEVSAAHGRIIARNCDKATLAKLEDATPDTFGIDRALVTVAAECACDVSELWIVGDAAAISALAGNAVFTPANGPDIGSYATRYGGAALYPTPTASNGKLTVFYPGGFRAFASPLASSIVVDPKSGGQTFGSWLFYGLGQTLTGAAVTIDTTP